MADEHNSLMTELQWQLQIMRRELPERLVLATLAYGLCLIWVRPQIIVAIWIMHMILDTATSRPQDPVWLLSRPWRYGLQVAGIGLAATLYAGSAGLVWQSSNPFSKAFAVGMVMSGLMHLITVRSIHLPFGIAGLAGISGSVLLTNTLFWLDQHNPAALALSTAACFGVASYTLTGMLANNRMHRSMAAAAAAARAADAAKGHFLAQMSHELRTPLNAIIGMGQAEQAAIRANAAPSPRHAERIQIMTDAGRTMALILDDVNDMEQIGSGKLTLRPRVVNLPDEINAIAHLHRDRATRLGIPLTHECEGDLPDYVRVDPVRLRQVVGNLLTNALRHAPQGAVHAACRCHPDPEGPGATLEVDVRDNGPGVPPDQQEAIFTAFHKGRAAAPGSGLGLAIARSLAQRMGGDLRLLPTRRGATFRLTLRLEVTGPPAASAGLPNLAGRRILVVDDVPTNRLVAAAYLRPMGAQVIEAASGEEALDILETEDLDLVLLDMNMPGLDGFATFTRAREMGGHTAAVPIVAMTADVLEDQVAAIRQAGLDGYLAKPLLPETLAAELARLLS